MKKTQRLAFEMLEDELELMDSGEMSGFEEEVLPLGNLGQIVTFSH